MAPPGRCASQQTPVRLAYLVSHPIQYQAPLLRRIAREPDIDLTVLFGSDHSVRGYRDEGFGVDVAWDVPLLDGYRSEFLRPLRDTRGVSAFSPISRGILRRLQNDDGSPAFDALWVHGYASVNALMGILAAKALGIPVLLRAESWLADRTRSGWTLAAKRLFFAALRPAIAATLPIGTCNRDYWSFYFGSHMPQFFMPYAVDNAFFAERATAAAAQIDSLRAELALESGRPVILFASKLQTRKHADHLIEAYIRLCADSPQSRQPYLILVGDGEERPHLEAMVRDHSLSGVRFAGFRNQSELPRFFALADVFVLPSRHEPWGLIVNEAMASGCAVIASSDVGAHRDLITVGPGATSSAGGTNGLTNPTGWSYPSGTSDRNDTSSTKATPGFVYPFGDIAALTAALRRALSSPDTTQQMGEAARSRIAAWDFEADVRGLRSALAAVTRRIRTNP